ncbi:MAG: SUMF1/EgtB/PvdO family nonheme iron enzyme [Candidatus Wallbacteria bacterium]|nr:SUMF1/EgtB/PvdO family nonheme iron enzyme [Candidatus Wallbacteria bacterium]
MLTDELRSSLEADHGLTGVYGLRALIAEGGMGAVYRAVQLELARPVAVKLMHRSAASPPAERAEWERRFLAEARLAARVSDPNVVRVLDAGSGPAGLFIAYELMEGVSLRELLDGPEPPSPAQGLALLAQAARGLAAVHAAGIVHRDLKPENMLIDPSGGLKLTDLGVARDLTQDGIRTRHGLVFGTPRYMSPEQCEGLPVGPASDIYSLGVVAYEVLAGAPPFNEEDVAALMQAHASRTPRPPSELGAELPSGADELLLRTLSKRPEDRPKGALELAADLEALRGKARSASSAAARATRSSARTRVVRPHARVAAPTAVKVSTSHARSPRLAIGALAGSVLAAGALALALRPAPSEPTPKAKSRPLASTAAPPASPRPGVFKTASNRLGYEVYLGVKDGSVLIRIPGGPFVAGGVDEEAHEDEKPQRRIVLSDFLIAQTETTWGQYRKFCTDTGKAMPPIPKGQDDAFPAVNVSWFDAAAYCQWAGLRLPSELEWEKAARSTDGRLYPWGPEPPKPGQANCKISLHQFLETDSGAHRVGKDLAGASPYGHLEMAGNVWEWCSDWYDRQRLRSLADGATDPPPPAHGKTRVCRGGAFTNGIKEMRCSSRGESPPEHRESNLGFRVASRVP